MQRTTSWIALGLGAHLLLACGDDANTTITTSATETDGFTTSDEPGTTTQVPTSGVSATTTDSSASDSVGATTTTTDPTTGIVDPDTDTSTGTTQGVDPDTGDSSSSSSSVGDDTSSSGGDDTSSGGDDTTTTEDPSETGNPMDCPLVAQHVPCDAASNDALHAFGLNCTSLGGDYVDKVNAVSVSNLDFQAPPELFGSRAWQVAKSYGTFIDPNTQKPFWGPREGEKLLMISSGLLPPANGQGAIIIPDGDVYGDTFESFNDQAPWDNNTMPPPMQPQKGSPDPMGYTNCDGTNDCSNTIFDQWTLGGGDAEDKMWFGFQLTAPAIANGDAVDANGYTFDFAYFSAEFPEYVDSGFNDIFVVWQDSEDYTGNVTFIDGQPMTVTALWPIDFEGDCDTFSDPFCNPPADPHLAGTGHIYDGGATGWYKATGGVKPGETFTLTFGVFDMGDSSFDTTALLDNWQWDCEGCVPSEVMSCGIDPQ